MSAVRSNRLGASLREDKTVEDTEDNTERDKADEEIELILAHSRASMLGDLPRATAYLKMWERWNPTLRSANRLRTICDDLCTIVDQLMPDAELPQSTRDSINKSIVSTLRLLARVDELTEEAKSEQQTEQG